MSFLKQKTFLSLAKFLVPILILFLISFEAKGIFDDFNWALLELYFDRLSPENIFFIIVLGLIALFPMYFYDEILQRLFRIRVPKKKLLFYSLSANAFSNLIGFGGVAGATLRSYFYKNHLSGEIPYIKIIAKLSLFYLTGLSFLSWMIIFSDLHLYEDVKLIKIAVWAIAAYTPLLLGIYFFRKSFWNLKHIKKGYIAELIVVSLFEWFFIIICIWGIAKVLEVSIPFLVIFPIVIISSCAGIASMIPGGIGSFDFVFLIGLESQGIPTELGLLILMFYRLSYYIVPVLLGTPFVMNQIWNNGNARNAFKT
ncbi:lysylphosphatidylglycerol synthase domain-containing protein [Cytobacillus oceanisediminis]|uniref:Phosphatidylglycerol lysyltransferase n=1 Tax=Cytobacillus oceanisediminis TaxID=665099 RepID=A0A562JU74_9BACI|nr:lysylphosphatidylglycerol synthase domain-containing protein [Cytobacillus oceanisediminis]TWH86474.1 phosphatidylglycerol lysyltransferase [Cytobacillus oceanisediminis]